MPEVEELTLIPAAVTQQRFRIGSYSKATLEPFHIAQNGILLPSWNSIGATSPEFTLKETA